MRHFIALLVITTILVGGFILGVLASADYIDDIRLEVKSEQARCLDLLEDNNRKWKRVLIDDAVEGR